ncbi:MAG: hypothetical protein M1818_008155 [Claussenomyces sp. TS43310]|nr:MAG: hypothetical protein M1818_008155 [Claussenomyces sp. TS43310]
MVALPLFKLGALFLRHISKYGANYIKLQAHDHPKFRKVAARYGQHMHQINMRLSVSALRDVAAEQRAKERAAAPTVKTEEQMKAEEHAKEKAHIKASQSVWTRKFRALPEAKAVDLFADIIGDAFILTIATVLIIYEYVRSKQKPDGNAIKLAEMEELLKEEEKRIAELERTEKRQQERVSVLEEAVEAFKAAKFQQKRPSPPTA